MPTGRRMGPLEALSAPRHPVLQPQHRERTNFMIKLSDICIFISVMVAFAVSGFLWFNGQKEEGLFTAVWVPSILCFGIYFRLLALKGGSHE
jgi:hypothetical protein